MNAEITKKQKANPNRKVCIFFDENLGVEPMVRRESILSFLLH
jgi:hypothetical protein